MIDLSNVTLFCISSDNVDRLTDSEIKFILNNSPKED